MKYTEEQIRELARDARILLTDREAAQYADELEQLAALAEVLCEVPTAETRDGTSRCLSMADLRSDTAVQELSRDALMRMSARSRDGYFTVPRAVEE